MGDLSLFIPEATVLLGALLCFALRAAGARDQWIWRTAVAFSTLAVGITAAHWNASGEPFFPGIYRVDTFSQILKLGVAVALALTIFASQTLPSVRERARSDMPLFFFVSALGMMMLVSATELLTLYVALELSAYGLYILAAVHRRQRQGSEGAAKYIIFGGVSSAVSLYGISLIFGATQTTYVADIVQMAASPLLIVGVLLTLAGLLFKLALFPFHSWAPDAYEGAPHQSAAFIGTASKVAAVGVLIRVMTLLMQDNADVAVVLFVLCVVSMTIGNLAAIVQKDFKRLLAYSTIAHAGYIAIGLLCFSELGIASAIFYVMTYVPIAMCAFLVICAIDTKGDNPTRADLAGLYKRSPLLAMLLLVAMFGLAGIPPTPGFAGKWFLFSAAIGEKLFWLVLIAAINATISIYYYLLVVREAFLSSPEGRPAVAVSPGITFAGLISLGLVVFVGFYPGPLWELARQAAQALSF